MRRFGIAGAALLIVAAVVYWQYQVRINAPLRATGPEAEAALKAEIAAQNEDAVYRPQRGPLREQSRNTLKNVYFGDLHIHTSLSFDSYIFGNRLDVETAYRVARGEEAAIATGEVVSLTRPLDFAAVTDHAEGFGLHEACAAEGQTEEGVRLCKEFDEPSIALFLRLREGGEQRPPVRDLTIFGDDPELARRMSAMTWQQVRAVADRYNEPGRFTTFAGYEYSPPLADTGKHHRNVIFKSSVTPDAAISMYHADSEIDLWRKLEATCRGECEFLTIPHNPNKSWGLAFASETIDGVPYEQEDWHLRARSEPIVEMFQIKGNSECSTAFGAGDEECGFEQFFPPCDAGQETLCVTSTSMVRDGLKIGLALENQVGINPMRFGLIGSTDTHNSNPGDTEEWDYRGASGYTASPARRRLEGGRQGNRNSVQRNPGGLAAVWAEENTREALFTAMKRREVYATSGTRIRLRVFAGYEYALTDESAPTVAALYGGGVPMGGVLQARSGAAPRFHIWAMKDPESAPLAKVQVIKGWIENGEKQEVVYDLACANDAGADPRCLPASTAVSLADCRWDENAGAAELRTWWQDPDFDSSQNAFYYVRVVQNPTCRWTTADALRLGVAPPADVPSTVQEMAWASPIWVQPVQGVPGAMSLTRYEAASARLSVPGTSGGGSGR
ncbi:MAG: DUF3604 domain-containing protein [Gammaproteobacteria bacterium]